MRYLALFALAALASTASAADPVTMPSTGVDLPGIITAIMGTVGGYLGAAIAAGFAIWAIWLGVKYIRRAFGKA